MSHIFVTAPPLARRALFVLGGGVLALAARPAFGANAQQEMIDSANRTIANFTGDGAPSEFERHMKSAVGVLIIPQLIKAGFIIGGEGGGGVLLARGGSGAGWSAPAFYSLASASVGLQAGAQASETVLVIRTRKALEKLLEDKVKFGADAGLAVVSIGGGVEGSTTTAAGADIIAFSRSKGLFGGVSLEGSVISPDPEANSAYYGRPVTPREILFEGKGGKDGAAALRTRLNAVAA